MTKNPLGLGGVAFDLPWPPSVNRWLRIWGGRAVKSTEWRTFGEGAGMVITEAYKGPILTESGICVSICLDPPTRRRFDIDNRAKGCLDAMEGIIYDNDYQVDVLTLIRGERYPGGRARVLVTW